MYMSDRTMPVVADSQNRAFALNWVAGNLSTVCDYRQTVCSRQACDDTQTSAKHQ